MQVVKPRCPCIDSYETLNCGDWAHTNGPLRSTNGLAGLHLRSGDELHSILPVADLLVLCNKELQIEMDEQEEYKNILT